MDQIDTETADREPERRRLGLDRLRLRFRDPALESAFRADRFRHHLGNIRFAFLVGIVLWISWGLLLRPYILAISELRLDRTMRWGVFIPMLVIGLALTFTPFFGRIWEWVAVAMATATMVAWVYYTSNIQTLPAEYGYVGVILITAFTYTLLRLRFVLVLLITLIGIGAYLPYAFTTRFVAPVSGVLATLYLVSFGFLGGLAAYRMERFTRTLFLQERQLDQERLRSDGLLLNILPQVVVDQLKVTSGRRIAQAFEQVTVIFVDAVGSTQQAARSSPDEFAHALDELFSRFDEIADRHGLEKIKTIGDAYMAVAGAPVAMADHAAAAVAMAIDVIREAGAVRWPSGDQIVVHGGVATGPAVAGVIGRRKFAYDLWGDTVNVASRLEEQGEPGEVLVSEATAVQLEDRYEFGPIRILDLKGKGPTPARALLGRNSRRSDRGAVDVRRPGSSSPRPSSRRASSRPGASAPARPSPRDPPGARTIVVGVSGAFAENQLVAEMYAQVLEHAGYTVGREFDLRSREVSQSALESGQIDLKPEYLSSLLLFLDSSAQASSDPAEVARQVGERLEPEGITVLTPSPAQDTNQFVANAKTAQEFDLTTLSSLAAVADRLTIGAPPECPLRPFCLLGLRDVYGILFEDFVPLDAGGPQTVAALKSDEVQIGLMFSTDPSIEANGFIPLLDDRDLQDAENITPVIRTEKLNDEVRRLLDAVSARLSSDTVTELVGQVVIDGQEVEAVATAFLAANGLL